MANSNDDSKSFEFSATLLEAPVSADSPLTGSVGTIFGGPGGQIAGKLVIVETLLGLVTRDLSYQEFMIESLIAIIKVVRCEAGSILELNHETNTLFFRAVAGTASDRLSQFSVPMGQGIVGHVAQTRLPMCVSNLKDNPLYLKAVGNAVDFEARNLVALPIIIRGKIFGVLELLNRLGDEAFTESDTELLTYTCEMMAKAIEIRLMISWNRKAEKQAA